MEHEAPERLVLLSKGRAKLRTLAGPILPHEPLPRPISNDLGVTLTPRVPGTASTPDTS